MKKIVSESLNDKISPKEFINVVQKILRHPDFKDDKEAAKNKLIQYMNDHPYISREIGNSGDPNTYGKAIDIFNDHFNYTKRKKEKEYRPKEGPYFGSGK